VINSCQGTPMSHKSLKSSILKSSLDFPFSDIYLFCTIPPPCPLQVRIWRTVRSQQDILDSMRLATGPVGGSSSDLQSDLVAYWRFNDAGDLGWDHATTAKILMFYRSVCWHYCPQRWKRLEDHIRFWQQCQC
jgi:hypothetical protein